MTQASPESRSRPSLDTLFRPESIAIVGASTKRGKLGHSVMRNLLACGYAGRIHPVNPSGGSYEGLEIHRSLAEIGMPIDCAMLVVPAEQVVRAAEECFAHGVRVAIVSASGFAETGDEEAVRAQQRLAELAAGGMRIVGPNTNGILNTAHRLSLGYNAEHATLPKAGGISFVSHSGALFGGAMATLRSLDRGIGTFIPVGNEADISMLEVLDYLVDDPSTAVIGLIVEGLSDGPRLRAVAQKARCAGKPIVAMKVGRSHLGEQATVAHSSRLAGSSRAYESIFRECGIALASSVETLATACALLDRYRIGSGDEKLVCISTSGAGGALLADFAAAHGIALAADARGEWTGDVAEAVKKIPAGGRIRHPIDTGSFKGDWARITDLLVALERSGEIGPAIAFAHIAPTEDRNLALIEVMASRQQRTGMPAILVAPGGLTDALEAAYRQAGVPLLKDFHTAFEALATYAFCRRALLSPSSQLIPSSRPTEPFDFYGIDLRMPVLSELDSATILRRAGVPVVESVELHSEADAVRALKEFGPSIVMKGLPPGLAHKSKAGLVLTGIADETRAAESFSLLGERIVRLGYDLAMSPRIAQPMRRSALEVFVGVSHEPGLGHFLLAGLGGVYVEILDEAVLIPIPTPADRIRELMSLSRLGRVLDALSDRDHRWVEEIAQILISVQEFIGRSGNRIASLDLNPLMLTPRGVMAVDALLVPNKETNR